MIEERMKESKNRKKIGGQRRVVTDLCQLKEEYSDWSSDSQPKQKAKKASGNAERDQTGERKGRGGSNSSAWSSDNDIDATKERAPDDTHEVQV